jgi:hypothetical protein
MSMTKSVCTLQLFDAPVGELDAKAAREWLLNDRRELAALITEIFHLGFETELDQNAAHLLSMDFEALSTACCAAAFNDERVEIRHASQSDREDRSEALARIVTLAGRREMRDRCSDWADGAIARLSRQLLRELELTV